VARRGGISSDLGVNLRKSTAVLWRLTRANTPTLNFRAQWNAGISSEVIEHAYHLNGVPSRQQDRFSVTSALSQQNNPNGGLTVRAVQRPIVP
jgi:hypothetical protein